MRQKRIITLFFLLCSLTRLYPSEIDQLTDRNEYQETIIDFTPALNEKTNSLIQDAVNEFNREFGDRDLSETEARRHAAFKIYRHTAGSSIDIYGFPIPDRMNAFYAIGKLEKGPLQRWIESDENSIYWVKVDDNFYSDIYPDLMDFNVSYVLKVAGEIIGPDKPDHFFDQGYAYWIVSGYGSNDNEARRFGKSSELSWFGVEIGGVFSFADLRANWQGYLFYRQLFNGDEPYLAYSGGRMQLVRRFDWNDYIDWQWDELKNPSLFSDSIIHKIKSYIMANYQKYYRTYQKLMATGAFSAPGAADTDHLPETGDLEGLQYLNLGRLFSVPPDQSE